MVVTGALVIVAVSGGHSYYSTAPIPPPPLRQTHASRLIHASRICPSVAVTGAASLCGHELDDGGADQHACPRRAFD